MPKEMKTVLAIESKPQTEDMMTLLGTLNQNERQSLLDFFRGAKFMRNLMSTAGG